MCAQGMWKLNFMLEWYYDENRIFPIEAILKHKKSTLYEKKNAVYFFQISLHSRDIKVFKICKLAKWWRHILNQILIKYDENISANL